LLVKNFTGLEKPWDETRISQKLEIPIRLVRLILYELVESGIVSEIKVDGDKAVAYQPALCTDIMTIKYVIDTLERHGSDNIPIARSGELEKLSECLKSFSMLIESSPANMQLKDI